MATKADPLQLVGRVAEFAVPPRGSARLLQTTRGRVSGPSEVKVVRKCLGRRQQGDATQSERGFDKAAKPSTLFVIVPLL